MQTSESRFDYCFPSSIAAWRAEGQPRAGSRFCSLGEGQRAADSGQRTAKARGGWFPSPVPLTHCSTAAGGGGQQCTERDLAPHTKPNPSSTVFHPGARTLLTRCSFLPPSPMFTRYHPPTVEYLPTVLHASPPSLNSTVQAGHARSTLRIMVPPLPNRPSPLTQPCQSPSQPSSPLAHRLFS